MDLAGSFSHLLFALAAYWVVMASSPNNVGVHND